MEAKKYLSLVFYFFLFTHYLLVYVLFVAFPVDDAIHHIFDWHFYLLLIFSFCASTLLTFLPGYRSGLLLLRIALFFLLTYPLGLTDGVSILLALVLISEIAFYLPLSAAGIYILATLSVVFFLGGEGSVFGMLRGAVSSENRLVVLTGLLFYALSTLLVRWYFEKNKNLEKKLQHLNTVISQLSHANLDFQRYVHSVEYSAVNGERRRISREIHDTVGYSLTNIIMTLEAAKELIRRDAERANEALDHSLLEARHCLEETRQSMRKMRSQELQEAVGLQAIAHLARSFSEATGMEIKVEYGNAPDSFGGELDLVLFRIVQEGITNAFRHGMASQVRITLWIEARYLYITISDNGKGSTEIVDGVGISGMRERVEAAGGQLSFLPGPDGFKVRSVLPLGGTEEG
ncbi:MAG TPA: sensor histidine kinase [Sediminispirochaeta sp.]|nr:sensor histidine kinase [Sediminispirochaeta sp.]